MLIRLSLIAIHPVIVILLGTILALIPHFWGGKYTDIYAGFVYSNKVVLVYILGFVSFVIGYLFLVLFYVFLRRRTTLLRNAIPPFLPLRFSVCIILIFLSVKLILIYGGVPLLDIAASDSSISNVNEAQVGGGGFFGLVFLLVIFIIILYPNAFYSTSNFSKVVFITQTIVILFFCVYTGKRQMLFVFSSFMFSFAVIYLYRLGDFSKLNRAFPYVIFLLLGVILFFVVVGNVRYESDVLINLDPILHYLSLPYINITNIIAVADSNDSIVTLRALGDTLLSGAPTILKSFLGGEGEYIPRLEKTSPSGIYEIIYWKFQLTGVICFMLCLGVYNAFVYKGAMQSQNPSYIYVYALTIWPLFSIFMYNHFLNWMFYFIPVLLALALTVISRIKVRI
ncbi:oligosaccharide repeat unit polymerase [Pseudomonas stutzeri]|nr:oligosaccharide repeat unit polymerase [Stutzerimonas stutzeri]